jgi:uncharacterized protein YhaN
VRIDALKLMAFGPFTDLTLDMRSGRQGFHLIYGPNEAGKSSALRALRQLLYGIPERSKDNFVHPHTRMRVGAVLRAADGQVLEIVRRKGRVGTLRGADDAAVVEEAALQELLQRVDRDMFETMFGISHADLVKGGQDIIQGGGDVGRLVFSAGSGIANLREIQVALQSQAEALFTPAAQKRPINEALGEFKATQKQLREAQLTGQEWARHDEALQRAESRKQAVAAELARLQKELRRLQRMDEALPLMARRRELVVESGRLAGAVLLPPDFGAQRRELQLEGSNAAARHAQAGQQIESLRREIAALDPAPALLEHTESLEALHRELGSQRKAAVDRVSLVSRSQALRAEAREILRSLRDDLTIEQAEALRLKKADALRIQQLGARYERIHTRLEDARGRLPELARELADLEAAVRALPPSLAVEGLAKALPGAAELAALEAQQRADTTDLASAATTLAFEQQRLALGQYGPEELEALGVPSLETIRVFEERFAAASRRRSEGEAEEQKARASLAEVQRRIDANRLEREVPNEADLDQARHLRDRGWRLIAATLAGHGVSEEELRGFVARVPEAATLAAAFESTLAAADAVADRLRREADRVAAQARWLADLAGLQEQLRQMEGARRAAADDDARLERDWAALWQPTGITPRGPREMAQWVRDFQALTEKLQALRSRRARTDRLGADLDLHRRVLGGCLLALGEGGAPPGETLGGLVRRAEALLVREQALRHQRTQLERDHQGKTKERAAAAERLQAAEADLGDWEAQWAEAVAPIGLAASAPPEAAAAFMEDLKSLFDKLKEAGILRKRVEGIDRDTGLFRDQVDGQVRAVGPDLVGRPAEDALLELHQRLKRARDAAARKEALQQQLAREEKSFQQAATDMARSAADLKAMCVEAGCQNPEGLVEAEQRSEHRRKLESEFRALDDQLRRLSAGATVEAFMQEALAVDVDALAGEIGRLEEAIESLEHEKSALDQSIGSERTELARMDGTSRAAALSEELQITLGRLENQVEHYARARIAARVLAMAIERYRDKSQGPILRRASELFQRISGGSFGGLRAEFGDDGRPVIVGVRPGSSETVGVEGMSDGTADQLYLALRLAGLETYLEKSEPLPFVVDDILIMFDNDRAAATLKVLAELSHRTQVIFFTHHRHLVDLAEAHIDPSILVQNALK